jgi:hypothetical protein
MRKLLLLVVVCTGARAAVAAASANASSSLALSAVSTAAATITESDRSPQLGMVVKALKDFLSLEDTFTKLFSARVPAERLFAALRRSDLGVVRLLADAAQLAHEGERRQGLSGHTGCVGDGVRYDNKTKGRDSAGAGVEDQRRIRPEDIV